MGEMSKKGEISDGAGSDEVTEQRTARNYQTTERRNMK